MKNYELPERVANIEVPYRVSCCGSIRVLDTRGLGSTPSTLTKYV